ncbi:Lrp/AsnC family transcriptional regulator [Actinospica durhamensis]|uniref:Lrp/AsnC family transcriptional regulator n=1 Tax=Actinospica durhamensis TaxID=1508375 RepID=A0A941IPG8_9ACTN|nr:Lrp/AsnC family transcriptional regulator [Actinospica durhamensis]MBR7836520.1 Lrp/AsnC family transcriptional regulator [Actinospica durhamensis]
MSGRNDFPDAVDWLLIDELQQDGRLSYNELGRRVRLSSPAVAERVRRLEEQGVITGYHAHVDPAKVGRTVAALVRMSCYGPNCLLRHPEVIDQTPAILEVHRLTGDSCCLLRVAVRTMAEFEELIDRLADHGTPSSTMVLSSPVAWRPVGR